MMELVKGMRKVIRTEGYTILANNHTSESRGKMLMKNSIYSIKRVQISLKITKKKLNK
jgi:hypothetical protein